MALTTTSPRADETFTETLCDVAAPALRAPTLLLGAGQNAPLVRLPLTCAAGEILGTVAAAFVHCAAAHRGREALLAVSATGALKEVVWPLPAQVTFRGAESASDGTTLLFAEKAAWLCRGSAPS